MGRLPAFRSREVISALQRGGFELHHHTGSHAVLRKPGPPVRRVTVPVHAGDIHRGTLKSILRQAGLSNAAFPELL